VVEDVVEEHLGKLGALCVLLQVEPLHPDEWPARLGKHRRRAKADEPPERGHRPLRSAGPCLHGPFDAALRARAR